jgi:hypothetical protein
MPGEPRVSVGTFIDGVGRSIRQTTRRITGEPAQRPAPLPPPDGVLLKIERSTLVPTEVYKGEQVTLTLRYQISGAPEKGVTLQEKSTLSRGGKELTVLKEESSEKENGVWENTMRFAVPGSAKPGRYTVTLQISAQGQSQSARHSFLVR